MGVSVAIPTTSSFSQDRNLVLAEKNFPENQKVYSLLKNLKSVLENNDFYFLVDEENELPVILPNPNTKIYIRLSTVSDALRCNALDFYPVNNSVVLPDVKLTSSILNSLFGRVNFTSPIDENITYRSFRNLYVQNLVNSLLDYESFDSGMAGINQKANEYFYFKASGKVAVIKTQFLPVEVLLDKFSFILSHNKNYISLVFKAKDLSSDHRLSKLFLGIKEQTVIKSKDVTILKIDENKAPCLPTDIKKTPVKSLSVNKKITQANQIELAGETKDKTKEAPKILVPDNDPRTTYERALLELAQRENNCVTDLSDLIRKQ